jgi:hypothetical protein
MSDLSDAIASPDRTVSDRKVPAEPGEWAGAPPQDDPYLAAMAASGADSKKRGVARATAIMMAAANLDNRRLRAQFRERDQYPFRAPTGEHGLDVGLIRAEVERGHKQLLARDAIILALLAWTAWASDTAEFDDISSFFVGNAPAILGFFLAATITVFTHRLLAKARVRSIFRQGVQNQASAPARDENVTISGGFTPFVGSGGQFDGWSFTINLAKADNNAHATQPVSVAELYAETEHDLRGLHIDGLELKDEVFVDGRDVREAGLFDIAHPARPKTRLPSVELASSNPRIRHYRVARIPVWGGQVVLSAFLKYTKVADTLFVETRIHVLSPLAEKFAAYESLPLTASVRTVLADFGSSVAVAPAVLIELLFGVAVFLSGGFIGMLRRPESRSLKQIKDDRRYNFGWPASLRETWSSGSYERYFQMVDNDFQTMMIKETLLNSLIESLEARNICTKTLNEASTKIFNHGVMMTGGSLNAQSMAVGKGAAATINSLLGKAKSGNQSNRGVQHGQ